jgi:hypothetical protein
MSDSLPGRGDKPNSPRSLDELTGDAPEDRDETLVQLNARIPKWMRKALKQHKLDTDEDIQTAVQKAIASYLDV